MLLSALAYAVELKSESKKQKRGVAFFGTPGYDLFGIVPAFGPSSWAPTGLAASSVWNPPSTPDIALAQVQVQATHNIALQVRFTYLLSYVDTLVAFVRKIFKKNIRYLICADNRP